MKIAVNEVADKIVAETCPVPGSSVEAATLVAQALEAALRRGGRVPARGAISPDAALAFLLRGALAQQVGERFPAERTRWPLLRAMAFEVGHIDADWRVVIMRHRDIGPDVGPAWTHRVAPAAFRYPDALFGGADRVRAGEKAMLRWFDGARSDLGVGPLDALFVCPVRTDETYGDSIWNAWTANDHLGLGVQMTYNLEVHRAALTNTPPSDPTSRLPKRSRRQENDRRVNLLLDALADQELRLAPIQTIAERTGIPRTTVIRMLKNPVHEPLERAMARRDIELGVDVAARRRAKDSRSRAGATDDATLRELRGRSED